MKGWSCKLLVVVALGISVGCQLTVKRSLATLRSANINSITVYSPDPVLARTYCDLIFSSGQFRNVACSNGEPLGQGVELLIYSEISNSSNDISRNLTRSLLSLTTYMAITSSADVNFMFQLNFRGEILDRHKVKSHGRIGMWAILPPWAGLFGTVVGTHLNDYRDVTRLENDCLSYWGVVGYQNRQRQNSYQDTLNSDSCEYYAQFLHSASHPILNNVQSRMSAQLSGINNQLVSSDRFYWSEP